MFTRGKVNPQVNPSILIKKEQLKPVLSLKPVTPEKPQIPEDEIIPKDEDLKIEDAIVSKGPIDARLPGIPVPKPVREKMEVPEEPKEETQVVKSVEVDTVVGKPVVKKNKKKSTLNESLKNE